MVDAPKNTSVMAVGRRAQINKERTAYKQIRAKKNICSKKNINTAYVRQKGVKQRIST